MIAAFQGMGWQEVLIIGFLGTLIYLTVAGLISAAKNEDWAWFGAIIAGWVVALGWLVGAVYLATHRKPVEKAYSDRPRHFT